MDDVASDDAARDFLRDAHRQNAAGAIVGTDETGAFVEPTITVLLADALPVVVDANVLRNDIAYAARNGRRTALIT